MICDVEILAEVGHAVAATLYMRTSEYGELTEKYREIVRCVHASGWRIMPALFPLGGIMLNRNSPRRLCPDYAEHQADDPTP